MTDPLPFTGRITNLEIERIGANDLRPRFSLQPKIGNVEGFIVSSANSPSPGAMQAMTALLSAIYAGGESMTVGYVETKDGPAVTQINVPATDKLVKVGALGAAGNANAETSGTVYSFTLTAAGANSLELRVNFSTGGTQSVPFVVAVTHAVQFVPIASLIAAAYFSNARVGLKYDSSVNPYVITDVALSV